MRAPGHHGHEAHDRDLLLELALREDEPRLRVHRGGVLVAEALVARHVAVAEAEQQVGEPRVAGAFQRLDLHVQHRCDGGLKLDDSTSQQLLRQEGGTAERHARHRLHTKAIDRTQRELRDRQTLA